MQRRRPQRQAAAVAAAGAAAEERVSIVLFVRIDPREPPSRPDVGRSVFHYGGLIRESIYMARAEDPVFPYGGLLP